MNDNSALFGGKVNEFIFSNKTSSFQEVLYTQDLRSLELSFTKRSKLSFTKLETSILADREFGTVYKYFAGHLAHLYLCYLGMELHTLLFGLGQHSSNTTYIN